MSQTDQRRARLDEVLDRLDATRVGPDLFSVVDLLESSVALRKALSDPGRPAALRRRLADELLGQQVGADTLTLLSEAAGERWASPGAMVAALEREAVRAWLRGDGSAEHLDEVEDELFRLERLVAAEPELSAVLADRSRPRAAREELLAGLLGDRVRPATARLAVRAVAARRRSFGATIESYLELAARLRQRVVARVHVAAPLSAEQLERLRAALARQSGREVSLQVVVDRAVLGGVRVELGDEVIEGTVAARLEDARRRLA